MEFHQALFIFVRFPRDPKTKQQWIDATGNGPEWWPSQNHTICSVHFEQGCFKQLKVSRRLFAWAIPTLKLRYMYAPLTMSTAKYENEMALVTEKCTQSKGVMTDDLEDSQDEDSLSTIIPSKGMECLKCRIKFEPFNASARRLENRAKLIVAKVYHFLEEEYKELTNKFGDLGELTTTYINYCQRTSRATGVSERIINRILIEEEEWKCSNKPKEEEPLNKRRRLQKKKALRRILSDIDGELLIDESGNNGTETNEATTGTTEQQNDKTTIEVETENGYLTIKTQPVKIDLQEAQNIEIATSNGYQTLQTHPVQLEFLESTPPNTEVQTYEPLQTQSSQIEMQNLDTAAVSMVSKSTCTDLDSPPPPNLPDIGPMYCGMEAVGTMLGPTIVGSIQTQPLMTADQLAYCSMDMDPTMNSHACALNMGPTLRSPHTMMTADQPYCGPNITDQLGNLHHTGYTTGLNYYVIF